MGSGVTIVTEEVSKYVGLAKGGSWEGASGLGERETGEREREKGDHVNLRKKGTEVGNAYHP